MFVRKLMLRQIQAYLLSSLLAVQPVMANVTPGNANTSLTQAGNGVPVVNIAAPNSKGLSHNVYKNYNVDDKGLILNNSTAQIAQSQLGGLLQNNPNLKGQAANVILNEVTGASRSQLKGYTEVFGKSANVVVANPYGITCNGCGFINTPRVTLSTGNPLIENDVLKGFDISDGDVVVAGKGLDATNQDYFDILTRTASIHGKIHANSLAVVTGINEVEYASNAVTRSGTGKNAASSLAIDSSALGGMYAGKISLVATEKGVGVNVGELATSTGDITIGADGKITLNRSSSAKNTSISSNEEINLSGQHYAAGSTTVTSSQGSANISNASVSSGQDITLDVRTVVVGDSEVIAGVADDGSLAASGNLSVKADNTSLVDSTVQATKALTMTTQSLGVDENSQVVGANIKLAGKQTLDGKINALDAISLSGHSVAVTSSATLTSASLDAAIEDAMTLSGQIETNDVKIDSDSLDVSKTGKLSATQSLAVAVKSGLDNSGTIHSAGSSTVNAITLKQRGDLVSTGSLNVQATTAEISGLTQSGDVSVINAEELSVTDQGTLLAGKALSVTAHTLTNEGTIAGETEIALTASSAMTNKGDIKANNQASFNTNVLTANGKTTAGRLTVTADSISLSEDASWLSKSETAIISSTLANSGSIAAEGELSVASGRVTNNAAIQVNGKASLNTTTFAQSSAGSITSGGNTELTAAESLDVDGEIESNNDISLTAASGTVKGNVAAGRSMSWVSGDVSLSGTLSASDSLSVDIINGKAITISQSGTLTADETVLRANRVNNQGRIIGSNTLTANTGHLANGGGFVSLGDATITSSGNVSNTGLIYAAKDINIHAGGNISNIEADLIADQNIVISGLTGATSFANRFDNLSGYVKAGNNLSIAASAVNNSRRVLNIQRSHIPVSLYPHNNASSFDIYFREENEQYLPTIGPRECVRCGGDISLSKMSYQYPVYERTLRFITENTSSRLISASAISEVLADNGITINANSIKNDSSIIHAGNNAALSAGVIENIGFMTGDFKKEATYFYEGDSFSASGHGLHLYYETATYKKTKETTSTDNVSVFHSTISAGGNLSISGSKHFTNSVERSNAGVYNSKNVAIDKTEGPRADGSVSFTPLPGNNLNLPSGNLASVSHNAVPFPTFKIPSNPNGLFVFSAGPQSRYVIETNPLLTNLEQFYGSEYFFNSVGFNPETDIKVLGDAYYDTRIISQAIFEQTGKRYLASDVGGDLVQMKMLLDSATAQAKAHSFTAGVALSAEQINQLTQDMVWYEPIVVNGQEVLAPKLYLANVDEVSLAQIASVSGNTVLVDAGDVRNSGSINAASHLTLVSQNEIANVAGEIVGGGDTALTAKNNIRNVSGSIAGDNVSLTSESGNIINQTFVQQQSVRKDGTVTTNSLASNVVTTQTEVGDTASIQASGNLALNAGKSINNTAAELKAGESASLNAGENIVIAAGELRTYDSFDGANRQSEDLETSTLASHVSAGGDLTLNANNDIDVQASTLAAGDTLALTTGNNISLTASQNRDETSSSRYGKVDIAKDLTHQGAALSGNNVSLNAGGNITSTASTIAADNNAALKADGNIALLAANDSHYRYSREETNKSFGRKKVEITESLKETVVGADISAGNNITIQAGDGLTTSLDESAVSVVGSALDAQGDVTLVADGDVTIQAQEYLEFSRHETIKKGFGGLSSKQSVDATSKQTLDASELLSAQNIVVKSGEDLQVLASDIVADGNVNLEALDDVLVAAGEMVIQSEQWTKASSFFSGGDLYSQSFDLQGEEHTTAAQSQVQSGGNLTVNAGSIKIVGSQLGAGESAALNADTGNVDILAAKESHTTYEEHEKLSIGLGDVATSLVDVSQFTDSLASGQAKIKVAEASYDKADTRTDETTYQGASVMANSDITVDAASDINVEGSTLIADASTTQNGDLTLKAGDSVRIFDVTNSRHTLSEETHGKAEVNVVVQHQAVEVAKAAQALGVSSKALKQAKNDYRQYIKQLNTLNTTLSKLEQELSDNQPGVTQADIIELKGLIADVKGDEEWYISGIALAAVDVTSKTTALAQQTAAAAQSTATYGFNAGIQLDIEGSKTQTESRQTTSQASQLAGNNIAIQAGIEKGNDATIKGSHLAATDSLSISANVVNIQASQETRQSSDNNQTVSGTIQATAYGATSGISVSLNGGESESQSSSTTHINSTLTADNIAITSTGDTTVRGANVDAQSKLALNVGGDLTVESVQDRHSSNNKSRGVSAGISFDGGDVASNGVVDVASSEGNVTGVNGGLNASSGRTYQTDTVLTSLTAGETATIKVEGHTQTNGALIATVDEEGDDTGNLTLETETLGFSDLKNTTYAQNSAMGISTGVGIGKETGVDGKPTDNTEVDSTHNSSTLQYQNSSDYSVTKTLATVGKGNVTVGGDRESDSLTALNRDVGNTEKDLFTTRRNQGNVNVAVDHRLLTEKGRKQISLDLKRTSLLGETLADVISEDSVNLENTLEHIDVVQKELDVELLLAGSNGGEALTTLNNLDTAEAIDKQSALSAYAAAYAETFGISIESATVIAYSKFVKGVHISGSEGATIALNDEALNNARDYMETLGHEVTHALIDQGAIKPRDSYTAEEQYASLIGEYAGDNYSFVLEHGGLGEIREGNVNANLGNTGELVSKNTVLAIDQLSKANPSDVKFSLDRNEVTQLLEARKGCSASGAGSVSCAKVSELLLLDVTRDEARRKACSNPSSAACKTAVLEAEIAYNSLIDGAGPFEDVAYGQELSSIQSELDDPSGESREQSLARIQGAFGLAADFTPGVGDVKGFSEAQSGVGYLLATVGLVPVVGDLVKKAADALDKGDIEVARSLLEQAKLAWNDSPKLLEYKLELSGNQLTGGTDKSVGDLATGPPDLNTPYGTSIEEEIEGIQNLGDINAGKVNNDRVRKVNNRSPINSEKYAGITIPLEDLPSDIAAKYPKSVHFSGAGFPDFTPYARKKVKIELTGKRSIDFRLANELAGYPRTPDDFTWHHHQESGLMLLIPSDLHDAVKHTGGVATSGIKPYK